MSPDLDRTFFAVHDALAWARRLPRDLGAVPIAAEALAEFRYLLMAVGSADQGARVELIEPVRAGYLDRHLRRKEEGPHHITIPVPACTCVRARGRAFPRCSSKGDPAGAVRIGSADLGAETPTKNRCTSTSAPWGRRGMS